MDINKRLEIPAYLMSTGDQRYWDANYNMRDETGKVVGFPTANLAQTGNIDDMLIEAKNFYKEVPRLICEIKQPHINTAALTQNYTPIKFIADIDDVPTAVYGTMRRIPIDYGITVTGYASSFLHGLNMYEHMLRKLFNENAYGFVWQGVIQGATYDFTVSTNEPKTQIVHSSDEQIGSNVQLDITLHLQFPAINDDDLVRSGDDTITDIEHGVDVELEHNIDISQGNTGLNFEFGITSVFDNITAMDGVTVKALNGNRPLQFEFAADFRRKLENCTACRLKLLGHV